MNDSDKSDPYPRLSDRCCPRRFARDPGLFRCSLVYVVHSVSLLANLDPVSAAAYQIPPLTLRINDMDETPNPNPAN